eukprot:6199295-Pleurochrysis_carterae.AAC.2
MYSPCAQPIPWGAAQHVPPVRSRSPRTEVHNTPCYSRPGAASVPPSRPAVHSSLPHAAVWWHASTRRGLDFRAALCISTRHELPHCPSNRLATAKSRLPGTRHSRRPLGMGATQVATVPAAPQSTCEHVQPPSDAEASVQPLTRSDGTLPAAAFDAAAPVAAVGRSRSHFQRTLGSYPLRSSTPAALLLTSSDPRTRKQAMAENAAGWAAAERAEIANHKANGSWTLMDRCQLTAGRSLVRLI